MTDNIKAVIFDIDGTLTPANSWNVLTEKLGASVEEHNKIHLARIAGAITHEHARAFLINHWQATGNANKKFITNIFKKTKLRKDSREIFSYLHNKGYLTCLITGSNNIYAQQIAKKLKAGNFYANCVFHFNNEGMLNRYDYDVGQGIKKSKQLNDFCKKNNIKLSQCVVVGDSSNDIEIFKATGRGIAVKTENEEVEIEKVAWKKINSLHELKNYL